MGAEYSRRPETNSRPKPENLDPELARGYVILRRALRDILHQAGVPSNPGWGDEEIVAAFAERLGVQDRYQDATRFTLQQERSQRIP